MKNDAAKSFEKSLKDNRSLRQQNIDSLDAQNKVVKNSNNPADIGKGSVNVLDKRYSEEDSHEDYK